MNNEIYRYVPPEEVCAYLPDRMSQLEYVVIPGLTSDRYFDMMRNGWRRFGHMLFKPRCASCTACQPIRVVVDRFRPDRSQRRVYKANEDTELVIGPPTIDDERIDLYWRHHAHHSEQKGWPEPDMGHGVQHMQNIIDGPIAVEEWAYYVAGKLVALSYIDHLREGYSGIYFFHDPEFRDRSLGNWICLSLMEQAKLNGLPYVYLGYFVDGCRSMEYKGRFEPNEVLGADGVWKPFRG